MQSSSLPKTEKTALPLDSGTGHWSGTPIVWDDALSMPVNELPMSSTDSNDVYGCFYWKALSNKNVWLKFDMSSMEFSAVDVPLGHIGSRGVIIAEAGEGRVGVFGLTDDGTSLCYSIGQIGGERSDQLKMDSVIPLPVGFLYYNIDEIQEGHVFIMGHGPDETGNNNNVAVTGHSQSTADFKGISKSNSAYISAACKPRTLTKYILRYWFIDKLFQAKCFNFEKDLYIGSVSLYILGQM
ncbi:hypothetical protein U9M48_037441 [Paspalum notatum var. saurae]|uniref:F-box protein n=1 Tax=Paspalum notatum var. saurae TaxID=547442 RepID=A0AAQ3UF03_PASNO